MKKFCDGWNLFGKIACEMFTSWAIKTFISILKLMIILFARIYKSTCPIEPFEKSKTAQELLFLLLRSINYRISLPFNDAE